MWSTAVAGLAGRNNTIHTSLPATVYWPCREVVTVLGIYTTWETNVQVYVYIYIYSVLYFIVIHNSVFYIYTIILAPEKTKLCCPYFHTYTSYIGLFFNLALWLNWHIQISLYLFYISGIKNTLNSGRHYLQGTLTEIILRNRTITEQTTCTHSR
jgi:hypothetical protein